MAVEARHMNLFQSKFITNRDFVKLNQGNPNMYNTQMDSMLPQAATMPETLPPYYQSVDCSNLGASTKTFINKADSGLTYTIPVPDQRKRPRDSINDFNALPIRQKTNKVSGLPSFLDQDIILQAHQQEIDRFLAQHAEKVRLEIGEQEERQSRMLESVFQEAIMNKLKEKDEEIQRMGKLNWVLQERVKSLCIENQIWRELAQTNEATANTLRSNLEQVLAHVAEDRNVAATADDAESSCGSNDFGRCTPLPLDDGGNEAVGGGGGGNRMCKNCGVGESRVLLLPCRHLCLCTNCGSTLRTCPVCHSAMTASVNVNLS